MSCTVCILFIPPPWAIPQQPFRPSFVHDASSTSVEVFSQRLPAEASTKDIRQVSSRQYRNARDVHKPGAVKPVPSPGSGQALGASGALS